ncbi:MAG: putative thiol-disulfide oxidoreductase YuxK, DCC family [Chloroflexi bacterium]|nr:MAG: putative thiol-disulfide oxidoreductase YuxK, DCC family [Chloroflexota bacterium]
MFGMAEHALGPALLYDDGCRFCRACAALVARWDRGGRVDLLPRSAAASVELLRTLDPALRDGSMHLIDREGRLQSGEVALLGLLALLPGTGTLARVAGAVGPVGWALGAGYAVLVRNRGRLSRVTPETAAVTRWGRVRGVAARVVDD